VSPAFADRDAPASPFVKAPILLVGATADHLAPSAVLSRPTHPVRSSPIAGNLSAIAATTFRETALQAVPGDNTLIPAGASYVPIGVALMDMGKAKDGEAAKNLPLEIVAFGHETLSHIGSAMARRDCVLAARSERSTVMELA
jgi:hypothetical protein